MTGESTCSYLMILPYSKAHAGFFTHIVDELDNRPDAGDACGAVEDLHRSYWSAFLAMKLRSARVKVSFSF